MTVINAKVGAGKYPVVISNSAINELLDFCSGYPPESVVCIVDDYFENNENDKYPQLNAFFSKYKTFFLSGGLESKGLEGYSRAMKWVLNNKLPRDGVIVAIGGGVIGDLSAFVASTYMRGTNLILVPTTTTSMIDSAIGGKTGINFQEQVNAIGTYYNPSAVFMDSRFLQTLNERDYYAGICEAIKMAITSDASFSRIISKNFQFLNSKARDVTSLLELITWSVKIKLFHVGDDPNEKGLRLTLNYGHTFGQAFESFYGLYQDHMRHGEAVALGMVCAGQAILSINSDTSASELLSFTQSILRKYCLPACCSDLNLKTIPSTEDLLDNLINDKKRTSQGNRFVLVPTVGTSQISYIKDNSILRESFCRVLS